MRKLFTAAFTSLIWIMATAAHAEIAYEDLPAPCEKQLTTSAKVESRDPRHVAAEVLLMLIFDHPILKAAVERQTTSADDLRTLFHLSGAFSLPPLKDYKRWRRDQTGFIKNVATAEGHSATVDAEFWKWQGHLYEIADDEAARKISPDQTQVVAESLLARMIYSWKLFATHRTGSLVERSSFPRIHFTYLYPREITLNWLFTRKSQPPPPDSSGFSGLAHITVNSFTALSLAELDAIPMANAYPPPLTEELLVGYLKLRLHEILKLREQILAEANGDVGKNPQALLKAYSLRNLLRDEIADLANGIPLKFNDSPILTVPVSGLSNLLPALRAEMHPDSQRLAKMTEIVREESSDALKTLRQAMDAVDYIMSFMPKPVPVDRLRDWYADPTHIESWNSSLLSFLKDVASVAQTDLEITTELQAHVKNLLKAVDPKFQQARSQLQSSSLSPSSIDAISDEIDRLQITMLQSLAVITSRQERLVVWLTKLNELQTLSRQFTYQRASGEVSNDSGTEILALMNALLSFKGIVSVSESKEEISASAPRSIFRFWRRADKPKALPNPNTTEKPNPTNGGSGVPPKSSGITKLRA